MGSKIQKHLRLLDHWIRQVATSAGPSASLSVSVLQISSAISTVTHHTETHWNTWSSRKHQTYYINCNCIVCWISEYLNKCILYNHIMYIWKPQSWQFESHQSEKLTGLQNHARFALTDSSTKTRHSWASRNATLQELAKWLVRKAWRSWCFPGQPSPSCEMSIGHVFSVVPQKQHHWPFGRASSCTDAPGIRSDGPIRNAVLRTRSSLPSQRFSHDMDLYGKNMDLSQIHTTPNCSGSPFVVHCHKYRQNTTSIATLSSPFLGQVRLQRCTFFAAGVDCTKKWSFWWSKRSGTCKVPWKSREEWLDSVGFCVKHLCKLEKRHAFDFVSFKEL